MQLRTIFYLIILISGFACNNEIETAHSTIEGNFQEMAGKWLFLDELEVHTINKLDSVIVKENGEFHFDFDLASPAFFLLRDKSQQLLLLLEPGENIQIIANQNPFIDGYEVDGSIGSQLLIDFDTFITSQKQRVDSLARVFNMAKGDPVFYNVKLKLDSVYHCIVSDQRKYVMRFIDNHSSSLASLFVLNSKLGNSIVFDEEEDFSDFNTLDSMLMLNYSDNKHAIDHHERVLEIKARIYDKFIANEKLSTGNKAPNIVMKDTSGTFISLRNLRGKTVLLYFWAGWNAKSRQDNRKLVPLHKQIKQQGVEIFGISLDENERVWKGAMNLDKLPWIQGSDLMGLESPANKKFNLNGELPFYYIIDPDGKIVSKNKVLEEILEDLNNYFADQKKP